MYCVCISRVIKTISGYGTGSVEIVDLVNPRGAASGPSPAVAPAAAEAIDSYGAPQADPISSGSSGSSAVAAIDSYGAPQADPISSGSFGSAAVAPVSADDEYGAPAAPVISATPDVSPAASAPAPSQAASDDYGAPKNNYL